MFIHSATSRIRFVLLMCALLGFSLLACVTAPAPTALPSTPTAAPSRTPGATPTKSGEAAASPGNTIVFKDTLTAGGENAVVILGSVNALVQASVKPESGLQITLELQKADTKKVLFTAKEGTPLQAQIPESGLYRIVVRDAGKSGGDYSATFIGSIGIAFSLNPKFVIAGRLPDNGVLNYLYTGRPGSTLEGSFVPGAKTDLVIKVYSLDDVKKPLLTVNQADPGKSERLDFTLPKSSNVADTFVITVSEANGNAGQYLMAIKTGN